jgi:EAL domain-containing protein (putative c-di-GMP-specific phosphodiesterase class I)
VVYSSSRRQHFGSGPGPGAGRAACAWETAEAPQTPDLRHAIDHHELSVQYQPQFEIRSGNSCGVEALARWVLPNGESIAPASFIPHAERTGQITALGALILDEACSTFASWSDLIQAPILCVNVSSQQVCHEFTAILAAALERTEFPAARLELEITENILLWNPEEALDCLAQWKRIGVRVAVDDFGVRSSGFGCLSRLPVDRLKIDKSLVHRMVTDPRTAAIVHAVIRLGEDFGFTVLAEGVETEAQFDLLAAMRCGQVQGYLLAHPVNAHEARVLLGRKWGRRNTAAGTPVPRFQ